MNYKLTLDRMEKLSGQIGLVQNRIAELANSKTELKTSVDLAISQSDQPGADPEIAETIDKINGIDAEIKRQGFILDSLHKELEKLPVENARKMQQFETLYDEFKKLVKELDRFAEEWNSGIGILEDMVKRKYPKFERFIQLNETLDKISRELKNNFNLCKPELVKFSLWGVIDHDVDCPYRLWRLFSKIPENGKGRWLNRRMRGGNLIETEN